MGVISYKPGFTTVSESGNNVQACLGHYVYGFLKKFNLSPNENKLNFINTHTSVAYLAGNMGLYRNLVLDTDAVALCRRDYYHLE